MSATSKLTLQEWLKERIENTHRIAATKTGADRAGWLEDGAYLSQAYDKLFDEHTKLQDSLNQAVHRYHGKLS